MPDIKYRQCNGCKQTFPETLEYYGFRKARNEFNRRCRECVRKRDEKWRRKKGIKGRNLVLPDGTKGCKQCGQTLPLEKFSIMKNGHYRPYCKECRAKYSREYAVTHYEQVRLRWYERTEKFKSLPFTLTKEQWLATIRYFDGKCAVCGKQLGRKQVINLDHWIPVNNPECPGTVMSNCVPMCKSCNSSKHVKDAKTWLFSRYSEEEALSIFELIQGYLDWIKYGSGKRSK